LKNKVKATLKKSHRIIKINNQDTAVEVQKKPVKTKKKWKKSTIRNITIKNLKAVKANKFIVIRLFLIKIVVKVINYQNQFQKSLIMKIVGV